MTDRLYYQDPYRRGFEAMVLSRQVVDGQPAVALDRTAFYPTGGGQPHDTGTLNGIPVLDVRDAGDLIWHLLAAPLTEEAVYGVIDWARRWDHMQNHSGQHILSQSFVETSGALTIAWHLSQNSLTIDLDRAGLSEQALADAEVLANDVVQRNLPITAFTVDAEALPALALRKQPDVAGPLRIVAIGDFDRVACAGVHVPATAQVGLIKLLRAERRGQETRIHFVCGGRALADYQRKHALTRWLALRFGCAEEEIQRAVDRLHQQAAASYQALKLAQAGLVEAETARLLTAQGNGAAPRAIVARYPDWPADQIKSLALALRSHPGLVVVLAGDTPPQLFVARSGDLAIDAGGLLRTLLTAVGGQGGGRGDYAQGALSDWQRAAEALALAASLIVNQSQG